MVAHRNGDVGHPSREHHRGGVVGYGPDHVQVTRGRGQKVAA